MVELELQLPLRSIDSRFFANLPALPISVANKLAAHGTEKSSKDFAGFDSNWLQSSCDLSQWSRFGIESAIR